MKTTLTMKKKASLTNGAKRIMPDAKENMSRKDAHSCMDNAILTLTIPIFSLLVLDYFNLNNFGYETVIVILNNVAFFWWKN